ncbi:MAG TPA: ABC transporter ATP-binding protein [Dissulfurispiraceae bacterium]|nr:ABC transporter ATP-binding protein [Dissulfurispiraceae bacterium]
MDVITAHALTKKYGDFFAVNGIDFAITQGECFGFLGPNGAGKTTTMKMISCFLPPSSGDLHVFDMSVCEKPSEIKARLGVMPQEDNLDPDLNIIENLIVYAGYFGIGKREAKLRAVELLKFIELSERKRTPIKDLSGGMKRRLMLVRALMNNPEIIMLDEPTTGLDPASRHSVWDRMNELKFNSTTLLLTTHYIEEAERLCDRVAIMDRGRIVAIDTPRTLMITYGGNLEDVYLKLTGRRLEG